MEILPRLPMSRRRICRNAGSVWANRALRHGNAAVTCARLPFHASTEDACAPQQPGRQQSIFAPTATCPKADALAPFFSQPCVGRSEEHTSELQSLMRISYAVLCLNKKHKAYYAKN